MRKGVWEASTGKFPNLSDVALRALCIHLTSCASERNWKLWGRVYTSSRTHVAQKRAHKMITFCFNSRAQKSDMEDMGLQMAVVEGDVQKAAVNLVDEDEDGSDGE